MKTSTRSQEARCDTELLAIHLLVALAKARGKRRSVSLDDLARAVGARRAEVRTVLSALHREALVDVLHMRPTLTGFALARAFAGTRLRPFRARAIDAAPATRAA